MGAGKSEALGAFARLGAETISTDAVVHELLEGEDLRRALIDRWGPDIAPAGRVDRSRVAELVFERPEELGWLEAQLHPRVAERIASWRSSLPEGVPVAVVEVPLLFETGMEAAFDAVVAVVAPEELRAARADAREHRGIEGRGKRQLSQDEKAGRATYVIENDGSLEQLEARIAALLGELTAVEGRSSRPGM